MMKILFCMQRLFCGSCPAYFFLCAMLALPEHVWADAELAKPPVFADVEDSANPGQIIAVNGNQHSPGLSEAATLGPQSNQAAYSLEQLVVAAIRMHPEVRGKRAELDAAAREMDVARWQYFPSPSVQYRPDTKGGVATVVALQQPIWTGGRLDAGLDVAESRARSAAIAIADTQYALAFRVVSTYQAWLQARGRGRALSRSELLLDAYLNRIKRRIEGGVSAQSDSELVRSRLAQVQADLAANAASLRSTVVQLSQMVGLSLTSSDLLVVPHSNAAIPPLDDLLVQAESTYPSLRKADIDIETAQHEIQQRKAALWPTLSLRAEYQHTDSTASSSLPMTDTRLMLALDYVPGPGLGAGAAIGAARARLDAMRESREAIRRDLVTKVSADYDDCLAALQRKLNLDRTYAAAGEVLASYDRLFVAGKKSWLDVVNAARELTQIEMSMADVNAQYFAAQFRLRLHTGKLTWFEGRNN